MSGRAGAKARRRAASCIGASTLFRLARTATLWTFAVTTVCRGGLPGAAAQTARGTGRQGEAFTFSLKFLGSFDAGRARMAVSPPVASPTGPIINVVAEAEATGFAKALTGLHEDYRLVLDATTLLPRRMHLVESGMRNRTATIDVTDRRVDIHVLQPPLEKRWAGVLPSQPLEPLAVLLLLRAARLQNGDKLELIVMDGTAFYQGTMEVAGRQELITAIGNRPAIKILCRGERISENGVKLGRPPRTAKMWVSDDSARLPLRVEGETELGTAEFALTGYEPGRRPLLVPKKLLGIVERSASDPAPVPAPQPAPGAAPARPVAPVGTPIPPAAPAGTPIQPAAPAGTPVRPALPAGTPARPVPPGVAPAGSVAPAAGSAPAQPAAPVPASDSIPGPAAPSTTSGSAPAARPPSVSPAVSGPAAGPAAAPSPAPPR